MATDIVALNVGGKVFKTTLSTLTSEPESLLWTMFHPDSPMKAAGVEAAKKDEEGAYFIDRSPDTFAVILEFLRTRKVYRWPGIDTERIKDEALYFGIESLLAMIDDTYEYQGTRKQVLMFKFNYQQGWIGGYVSVD